MVIKGSARAAPGELAYHLLREDTNEAVELLELRGVASETLPGALAELDGMGAGSRSKRTLYHASINTPTVEQLTPDQQRLARMRLAEELGLTGQPFAVVEHVKNGRQHTHIVWSRIDVETGKAISDSHNYRKHELVSRELEIEFGHAPVPGAHIRDKEQEPRPERGPTWGEQRQAERSSITPQEAKQQVTDLWNRTGTGVEFAAALTAEGWTVARGDRRDFVLVDRAGEVHSLARRIAGVKAGDVRDRMADVNPEQLPTVDQAKQRVKEEPQRKVPDLSSQAIGATHPKIEDAVPQQKSTTSPVPTVDDNHQVKRQSSPALLSKIVGWIIGHYERLLEQATQRLNPQEEHEKESRPPAFDPRFAREELSRVEIRQELPTKPPSFDRKYAREETSMKPEPPSRRPPKVDPKYVRERLQPEPVVAPQPSKSPAEKLRHDDVTSLREGLCRQAQTASDRGPDR